MSDRPASARLRDGAGRRRSLERRAVTIASCCCRSSPTNPPGGCAPRLRASFGVAAGVVISDSFGRPWRLGTTNVALGGAGVPALWDRRGEKDRDGRTLEVTAGRVGGRDRRVPPGLVMGEGSEGVPCALVRGLTGRAGGAGEAAAAAAARGPVSLTDIEVIALTGGIGGCKLALGLQHIVLPPGGSPASSIRATISAIWGCTSRPISTPRSTRSRARRPGAAAGDAATRPGRSCACSRSWAARPGSGSAMVISRCTSSARAGSPPASR